MRLRMGWLVRCRSTIFIRFHPRRRSFHQLLLSFIFFSIEEERRLCDAKESQSTKPVSWSLTLSLIASCCSWESQEIPKAKPGKVSWSSPWLLLAALGRVRKYQRQSQEKSHDPLLHRFRKTAFTDSENTPTMQSQENLLHRFRKTFFTESGKQIMVPLLVATALGTVRAKLPWRDLQRQQSPNFFNSYTSITGGLKMI